MTSVVTHTTMPRRLAEFIVLFWFIPLAVAAAPTRSLPPIPVLWLCAIAALVFLRRQPDLDRSLLWGVGGVRSGLPGVLARFMVLGPALAFFAWVMEPEWFLSFPRERTGMWVAVMILYPLASVVPQGVLYRTFLHHRYRDLFGDGPWFVLIAATTFAFGHVVMHRWEPVLITFIGGVVFTTTLLRRRSGLLVDIEHAIYGDLAFTLGLGVWLYTGAARAGL